MLAYFENRIDRLNEEHGLEMDLKRVAHIYGENLIETMADLAETVETNIEYLLARGFGEDVSDIFNRYAPILAEDEHIFRANVEKLIAGLGADYVDQLGEDMSHWERLM